MDIISVKNPKIKDAKKLWKHRERDATGRFLIEGYRELSYAVDQIQIELLFICPELFLGENEQSLIDRIHAPIYRCSEHVFRTLSYRDRPDGLIAVGFQKHRPIEELKGNFFIIAESIEKPGNLGTILRCADAAGVDAVIVCDPCTDIHNPNVVRASVGTLFTVPVFETSSETAFHWLKENKIKIVSATPAAEAIYSETNLNQSIAIVVGAEQYGLTPLWCDGADIKVRIPMLGAADSLNVAMATAILVYEAVRQKRA